MQTSRSGGCQRWKKTWMTRKDEASSWGSRSGQLVNIRAWVLVQKQAWVQKV